MVKSENKWNKGVKMMRKRIKRTMVLDFMKATVSTFSFLLLKINESKMSHEDLWNLKKLRKAYEDGYEDLMKY